MSTNDDGEYRERQWNGELDAVIESETDPWIKDENGQPVNILDILPLPKLGGTCEECEGTALFAPSNTDFGIQRCDNCAVFTGDLEAARALAAELGPGHTVWFHGA